ncbi:hypothetical protein ACE6H2_020105 [Prunus campanulata]
MSNKNENHQAVPLSVLLKIELANEKIETERPEIVHGQVSQSKKGEDFTLLYYNGSHGVDIEGPAKVRNEWEMFMSNHM